MSSRGYHYEGPLGDRDRCGGVFEGVADYGRRGGEPALVGESGSIIYHGDGEAQQGSDFHEWHRDVAATKDD
jgi:hypothetical protein